MKMIIMKAIACLIIWIGLLVTSFLIWSLLESNDLKIIMYVVSALVIGWVMGTYGMRWIMNT